jgi:2-isopropylmalate synthase
MVHILDSTLREGEQTPGVYFAPHAKLAIGRALDAVGVSYIEAGHPVVSPSIETGVRRLAKQSLRAKVAAHARSLKEDVDKALDCGVDFVGIFYCVGRERLNGVFKKNLSTAIEQITTAICYARSQRPDLLIRYTPEDTVRSRFEDVVQAATAAVHAGADVISIADTTGDMIPRRRSLYDFVRRLRDALEVKGVAPALAVHCHNDRGLALANALEAYHAGVDIIDTTVLGLGERAGIVDLAQLVTVLTADCGEHSWDLTALPNLYRTVSIYSGVPVPPNLPVTGEHAFTHCAGVHTHAALQNPLHYQSLDPALVGREMQVCLDHMSGKSSVQYALERIGEDAGDAGLVERVLARVKEIGEVGRTVDVPELRDIVHWCKS